jgi:hypothetical protein
LYRSIPAYLSVSAQKYHLLSPFGHLCSISVTGFGTAPLQGWLTRVWQLGLACLGAAVLALTWLQPRARPVPASADFELVMEPTRKHTPDLPRAQAV